MPVTISPNSIIRKNDFIRELLRKVLTGANFHISKEGIEDIFLFSSRRSGSTWLMEAMAAEKGLRFVNEPFGIKYIKKSYLNQNQEIEPYFLGDKLFGVPDRDKFLNYINEPRHTKICSSYNVFNGNYHLITNRRILKIIHANPIMDVIADAYPEKPKIFLTRHFVPNVLSMSKAYPLRVKEFLGNDRFLERLTNEQIDYSHKILKEGIEYQKWTLEWVLDQLVPFNYIQQKAGSIKVVSYEQFVQEPAKVLRNLQDLLKLGDIEAIIKLMSLPSASTSSKQMKFINSSDAHSKVSNWRNKVDKDQLTKMQEVVDTFGIDYYSIDELIPAEKYLV